MTSSQGLSGKRVLVVEDDYYAATELSSRLSSMGWDIVGPSPNVEDSLVQIDSAPDLVAAVLDVRLGSELVFPVADELERRGLPFIFMTALEPDLIPIEIAGEAYGLPGAELERLLALPMENGLRENCDLGRRFRATDPSYGRVPRIASH